MATGGYLSAQCEVNAGNDTSLCITFDSDTFRLEGSITAGDSVTTHWSTTTWTDEFGWVYGSDVLSDTQDLNPVLIDPFLLNEADFVLHGITPSGESCSDTVHIKVSYWAYLAIDKAAGKGVSDTLSLWVAAQSNWPTVNYTWTPNLQISDTSSPSPLVWNDTTRTYFLLLTDSLGCSTWDDPFEVYVQPASSIPTLKETSPVLWGPNPTTGLIYYQQTVQSGKVEVINGNGQICLQSTLQSELDMSHLSEGYYWIRTWVGDKYYIQKLIKMN